MEAEEFNLGHLALDPLLGHYSQVFYQTQVGTKAALLCRIISLILFAAINGVLSWVLLKKRVFLCGSGSFHRVGRFWGGLKVLSGF